MYSLTKQKRNSLRWIPCQCRFAHLFVELAQPNVKITDIDFHIRSRFPIFAYIKKANYIFKQQAILPGNEAIITLLPIQEINWSGGKLSKIWDFIHTIKP